MRTDKVAGPIDWTGAGEMGRHREKQLREQRATREFRQAENRASGDYMRGAKHSHNGKEPK